MEDFGEKKHVIEIDTVETVLPENTCCQAQLLPMVSSIRPQLERLEKRIGDINSLLEQRLPCPGMEGIEVYASSEWFRILSFPLTA
jgi:hypothetical protein